MIKGIQILIARNLLGLKQQEVADASGLSLSTITRVEAKRTTGHGYSKTTEALEKFFKKRGVEFIEKNEKIGVLIDEDKIAERRIKIKKNQRNN